MAKIPILQTKGQDGKWYETPVIKAKDDRQGMPKLRNLPQQQKLKREQLLLKLNRKMSSFALKTSNLWQQIRLEVVSDVYTEN